jgi:hypothetical protein
VELSALNHLLLDGLLLPLLSGVKALLKGWVNSDPTCSSKFTFTGCIRFFMAFMPFWYRNYSSLAICYKIL